MAARKSSTWRYGSISWRGRLPLLPRLRKSNVSAARPRLTTAAA
ncbi:Uncharacterised protein [Bordetella pertussis]|nr:Uncharacterised protein [Bordetella pertussis]